MRLFLASSLLLAALSASPAFAQAPAPTTAATQAQVSPATKEAVHVVDSFMAALANGQFDVARQLMTPEAIVMSNGQVLGNRDGYLNGPAKGDAAALHSTTSRELLNRDARTSADMGYVITEKRLQGMAGTQQRKLVVTETMLLAKTAAGWKISHIHWSGHPG